MALQCLYLAGDAQLVLQRSAYYQQQTVAGGGGIMCAAHSSSRVLLLDLQYAQGLPPAVMIRLLHLLDDIPMKCRCLINCKAPRFCCQRPES
jgi:hypothetical protein